MTLRDLEDDTLVRCAFDPQKTNSDPRTRIRAYLNDWHRRIVTQPGLERLRDDVITFATVAAIPRYALPLQIAKILRIYEPTTNRIRLVERSLDWLRNMPSTTSGAPEVWVPLGYTAVATQPSTVTAAGTALWITSTSASDTVGKVYVEGARTGASAGDWFGVNAALNGTSSVQLGTVSDALNVNKFYLDAACQGAVSLMTLTTGGTTLATIPAGELRAMYFTIILWPTPASIWTMNVDYTRAMSQMVQPTDTPLLPEDFHYLLGCGARANEYEFKKDFAAQTSALRELQQGQQRLMDFVCNNDDYIVVPGEQPRSTRFSNLGSYFPSGTW
jgi:hypothetical protein